MLLSSRARRLVTLLPLLGLLLAAGCARNVERAAERRVNALLPGLVGPADRYASRVRSDGPGALMRGRMKRVHVEGTNVRLSEELTVDTLRLDLAQVEVDTKARQLRSIESIAFAASIGEANLNRYVRRRRPDIPALRVTLGRGTGTVYARPVLLGVSVPEIAVDGTVTPAGGGGFLDFTPGRAHLSVVPIPAPVLRYISEKLNPVVDLSALRIPVRVDRTEIQPGSLLLTGSIDPANLLRSAAAGRP